MTPKEELIQAIERSPDDLVRAILALLKVWQREQSQPSSLLLYTVAFEEQNEICHRRENMNPAVLFRSLHQHMLHRSNVKSKSDRL